MLAQRERPAVVKADHFVHAVGELEAPVLDPDVSVGQGHHIAVEPDEFIHDTAFPLSPVLRGEGRG